MKFINIAAIVAVMFGMFGTAEASVDPAIGNEVHVNCTFHTSGSTVYSIENSVFANGIENTINLPAAATVGASCTAVINVINTATCAAGGHNWTVAVPNNTVIPRKGGYLQKFVFTCV